MKTLSNSIYAKITYSFSDVEYTTKLTKEYDCQYIGIDEKVYSLFILLKQSFKTNKLRLTHY